MDIDINGSSFTGPVLCPCSNFDEYSVTRTLFRPMCWQQLANSWARSGKTRPRFPGERKYCFHGRITSAPDYSQQSTKIWNTGCVRKHRGFSINNTDTRNKYGRYSPDANVSPIIRHRAVAASFAVCISHHRSFS